MKYINTLLFLFFVTIGNSIGQSYQKTDLGIKSVINSVGVEIQFYGPSLVRVLKWPEDKTFTKESLSVIKNPQKTAFGIKQQGDELSLKSENLLVMINLKNGRISFKTLDNRPLLNEKEAGVVFTGCNDAGNITYTCVSGFYTRQR